MSDEPSSARRIELGRRVTGEWVAGRLRAEQVLPALAALLGEPETTLTRRELLASIEGERLPGLAPLERWLESACAADARAAFEHRRRGEAIPEDLARELSDLPLDAPPGWTRLARADRRVDEALRLLRSETYIVTRRDEAPAIAATIEAASMVAALNTSTLTGASSELSARLRAVTTTSCRPLSDCARTGSAATMMLSAAASSAAIRRIEMNI